MNAIDAAGIPLGCLLGDALSRVSYAPDGIEHPQFVARSDAAVEATIAHERWKHVRFGGQCRPRSGRIAILEQARKRRTKIVRVHPIAGFDRSRCEADWYAILDDLLIGPEGCERDFMTGRDILASDDLLPVDLDIF